MTDKEFNEINGLLDSLTDGVQTLATLFPEHLTDKVKEHPDFKFRWGLLTKAERQLKDLAGLMARCEEWTSRRLQAERLHYKMRSFISATSDLPVSISGPYKNIQKECFEWLDMIMEEYPDLYPPFIRNLIASDEYKNAVSRGWITKPFNWNDNIKELAFWLDGTTMLTGPISMTVNKKTNNNWSLVDCVFRIDGEPVTAGQLRNAFKKKG